MRVVPVVERSVRGRRAFDVPSLTWKFGANVAPPSVENVAQIWTSSFGTPSVSPGPPFPRSFRASYHDTADVTGRLVDRDAPG